MMDLYESGETVYSSCFVAAKFTRARLRKIRAIPLKVSISVRE